MIKVLVVDDSKVVQKALSKILESDPMIQVVGVADDPYDARDKIKLYNPDVLTLDICMPRMDGITFLKNLMRLRPMPVVMVSSLTGDGAKETLDALEAGAVDYMPKPTANSVSISAEYGSEIIRKVKTAAVARLSAVTARSDIAPVSAPAASEDPMLRARMANRVIAIGASTGGTEALREVLSTFPEYCSPVVISQHIPEAFSAPFARRLDLNSKLSVKQAEDGDVLKPGCAYLAPGDQHLKLRWDGASLRCILTQSEKVNRHRPSVDVMFDSVAKEVGKKALGVLLTGMGNDGARGLLHLQEAGAPTIAQDEKTSVVWGMPGEAVKLGAADHVLPLNQITARVMGLL
ncbi:MAG: chemotaxis response regulator protein-glutamate methylesterase [Amphritea sp.]|nr:chemotaxis response regulator protein-glutamate methylesterase [Amphritea sp.]